MTARQLPPPPGAAESPAGRQRARPLTPPDRTGPRLCDRGVVCPGVAARRGVVQADPVAPADRLQEGPRARLHDLHCTYLMTGDHESAFVALLDLVTTISGSEFGFVSEVLVDETSGQPYLRTRALTDIAWDADSRLTISRATSDGMRFDNLNTLFGRVVTTGQVVISNEPEHDPRSGGVPMGHPDIECFLGLPIVRGGDLVGVIGLANRTGGYDMSDVMELEPITATAGALITHVRRDRERRSVEVQVREDRDQAAAAAAAKGFFLSRMSHELRTPLNAMLGFAQLIQIRAQDDRDRRDAGRVVSAGRHLMALLDEVMDVSSIDEGRITLQLQSADLLEAAVECISLVEAAAHERSVTVRLVATPQTLSGEPIPVAVDPARLRQVVLNLLDNAVKYNRPGGAVHVRVESIEGRAILEVHDEGRGISEEGRDRVFEPFERLNASVLGIRGSGLGLSVARSLARAMSGDVQLVSSRPGHTIFRVTLLAGDDSAAHLSETVSMDPLLTLSGHVLYVEDQPMNALLVRSILEHAVPQITVEVARTGHDALEILRERTPDLVLLDLHLPDMNGLDVLAESAIAHRVPVHVITADVSAAWRARAAAASVSGYLLKPVSPQSLVECVVSALSRQEGATADAATR